MLHTGNNRYEYLNSLNELHGIDCSVANIGLYDRKVDVIYPVIEAESDKPMLFDDFFHGRTLALKRHDEGTIDLNTVYVVETKPVFTALADDE